MQLSEPSPPEAEDQWLAHWVTTAFNVKRPFRSNSKGLRLGLAVSGGGDSMAMLHLYARHSKGAGDVLFAATVDHGLRPEARSEAEQVQSTCKELGLPHEILTWQGWDKQGNVQAEARKARYALLADWATRHDLDFVLIGHTADDVAETFLSRLARGSGLDGLAAMEKFFERNGVEFARPLLSLDREMLRRYLRRNKIEWIEDPSNEDRQFERVRARDALKALAPLGIDHGKIVSAAYDLSMAKSALHSAVYEHAETAVFFDRGDILLNRGLYSAAHVEIQRRILIAGLQWQGRTDYPPRASNWPEIDIAIHQGKPYTVNGCIVSAEKDAIRISREYNAVKDLRDPAGELWDGRWRFEGPHIEGCEIAPLGEEGIRTCPVWRETGRPRHAVLASPAVWRGEELIASPLTGLQNGWCAQLTRSREQFLSSLLSH